MNTQHIIYRAFDVFSRQAISGHTRTRMGQYGAILIDDATWVFLYCATE